MTPPQQALHSNIRCQPKSHAVMCSCSSQMPLNRTTVTSSSVGATSANCALPKLFMLGQDRHTHTHTHGRMQSVRTVQAFTVVGECGCLQSQFTIQRITNQQRSTAPWHARRSKRGPNVRHNSHLNVHKGQLNRHPSQQRPYHEQAI